MVTAIQIFVVLLVLFNFFVLFMCAKRWRIVHVIFTFLVFASAIAFVFFAALSLKTRTAWQRNNQQREKELEKDLQTEQMLKFGDLEKNVEDTETNLVGAKAAVEREQYDRGRIWTNCVVAQVQPASVTVNTFTPDPAAPPETPVRANRMVEKMILFAFKEREMVAGDGYKVPYQYLGEFVATGVTDTSVTLAPTLPLDTIQETAINTADATWVLYEVMPIDSHEAFQDPKTKQALDRETLKQRLGTDEKKIIDEYAFDLKPVREIEAADKDFVIAPERVWIKVKFLKAHSVEVDSTDAPAADKTLFDTAGRALPLSLRQFDKTSFDIGDFAVFDRESATQLINDGICDKVEEVYVRALNNYEQHFHEIDKRLKKVAENSALYAVDTDNLKASNAAAQKQADYRLKERDSLASDLKGVLYERAEVTAYRAALETTLAQKRAELSELYRTNNLLAAELAAIQKKIADDLSTEPTAEEKLETISTTSP